MYSWWYSLLVATLLAQRLYAASFIPKNERCVTAVYTALNYISFTGEPTAGLWQSRCQNRLKVTSIYAAADIYCEDDERLSGFAQLNRLCREKANIELLSRQTVAENLTDERIRHMKVVDFHEIPRSELLGYLVMVSPAYYDRTFRTIITWQIELWSHYAYGYIGYLYWGCILLSGMFLRLIQHITHSRWNQSKSHPRNLYIASQRLHQLYRWAYVHILIAFPLKPSNRRVFWFDLPTRIDALLIAGFWLLSIILTCITYELSDDNIYWPEPAHQLIRYIADRTGMMAFANLPLVWLFAGRNNIFIWATGWSFATFNIFHRHVAWIATLQAIIHSLAYLALIVQNSGTQFLIQLSEPFLLWGTAATLAMFFILPLAVDWFRQYSYEFFLFIHITFSIVTLVGCFYHVIVFKNEGYDHYLWPVVYIWVSERLLRLVRIIYCNLHVRYRKFDIHSTSSTATYDEASNIVRLEVVSGSSAHRPGISSYYYLYQPLRFRGWESHPFTLGSWNDEENRKSPSSSVSEEDNSEVDDSKRPLLAASQSRQETYLDGPVEEPPKTPSLIFWIRPYNGWTRALRDRCLASPDYMFCPRILLEGPYGEPFSLWEYDSVLLIAGGTGIACAVPHIQELLRQSATNNNSYDDPEQVVCNKIHLVWAAREVAFTRNLASRELRGALSHEQVQASFYITGNQLRNQPPQAALLNHPNSDNVFPSSSSSIQDHLNTERAASSLSLYQGRPNIHDIVLEHAKETHNTGHCIAVVVSGPNAMADEVRTAVYFAMRKGYHGITFREESFSW